MDTIACSLVNPRDDEQEQEMSQNTFDQFNDLVTRLAAADGTIAEERSHEVLATELACEILESVVGGQDNWHNPYAPGGLYGRPVLPIEEAGRLFNFIKNTLPRDDPYLL